MIDIQKHKDRKIKLKSQTKDITYELSEYEVSRWLSLIESVDIIDTKCKQLGVEGDAINWVKPIAIQKYIDERTERMLFEIKDDVAKEETCTT